ncbi:MAG: hypothetical protein ABI363_05795 [Nitrosospira sp.]
MFGIILRHIKAIHGDDLLGPALLLYGRYGTGLKRIILKRR